MKILAQVNAVPLVLLWDEPKVLMQLELTAVDPNSAEQTSESVEFVVDAESLTRLGKDLIRMAGDLEKKGRELGFATVTEEPEAEAAEKDLEWLKVDKEG